MNKSESVCVRLLRQNEVSEQVAADISDLLKGQHSKARRVDAEDLLCEMKRNTWRLAVAWNAEKIVGLGLMLHSNCLSHRFETIHHLVVKEGYDAQYIAKGILTTLVGEVYGAEFIEANVWPKDEEMITALVHAGFTPRSKVRYRYKLK